MKFGQLIYNITREIFSSKNHAENEAGELIPDLVLFFKKALREIKGNGQQFISIYFNSIQLDTQ